MEGTNVSTTDTTNTGQSDSSASGSSDSSMSDHESASRGPRLAIELDTVVYGTIAAWRAEVAEIGVEATLLVEDGPGGGNPLFRYEGTRTQLRALLRTYFQADRQGGMQSDDELAAAVPA